MHCGVRIVLDLSYFFEDKRKKSYFYIDYAQNKTVHDVHVQIRMCFGIVNNIALELNGCFLHENVDVHVLYNEDLIKVYDASTEAENNLNICYENVRCIENNELSVLTKSSKKKRKLKTLNVNKEDDIDEAVYVSETKKKCRNTDENQGIGHNSGIGECDEMKEREDVAIFIDDVQYIECELNWRSKGINSNAQSDVSILDEEGHISSSLKTEKKKFKEAKANEISSEASKTGNYCNEINDTTNFPHVQTRILDPDLFVTKSVCETDFHVDPLSSHVSDLKERKVKSEKEESQRDNQDGSCKKRRRRRRKKTIKDIDLTSEHNYSAQSINISSISFNGLPKSSKHIKFVDDNTDNNFDSADCEYDNSYGNNEANGSICKTEAPTDNVRCLLRTDNFQSNRDSSLASTSFGVENMERICGNIVQQGNSNPLIFECKKANRSLNSQSLKTENGMNFSKYPILKNCPKVNDIIAFKIWKMDANYCPGISEYISAKVLKVSERDGTVNLRILNGHTEFEEPKGKFSLVTEEAEGEEQVKKVTVPNDIHMNIPDLLDIRLMFP